MVRSAQILFLSALFSALLAGLGAAPVLGEDGDAEERKRVLARKVMEVTGVSVAGDQVAHGLLGQIRPAFSTVPEEVWTELAGTIDVDEIIAFSIPIYARHFDEAELSELVAFYESPLGRKMMQRMPAVAQESTRAFDAWNQAKLREVAEKLMAMGYEFEEPSPGANSPPSATPEAAAR